MITDLFLVIVQSFGGVLFTALPTWTISPSPDYLKWTMPFRYLNYLLPIGEIVQIATLTTAFYIGMFGWKWVVKVVDWIADVIP